ncbi:hypothetical protein ACJMK2_020134 [Sinanodonta woodiana]|uniref:VDE lipocalin domain-containing protein n=1 Tax=Sinanodonta woodiana TaxID=1069815 RepID=A0ABD3TY44_SINWO
MLYQVPNIPCMVEHCSSEMFKCVEDADCRHTMTCMQSCVMNNHTCMYGCLNTYEDATFDSFMNCIVDGHHCMKLEPPDPGFRCNPPAYYMKNFTLDQLVGSWYIVRGINPDYDCFDCQISTYTPDPASSNYTLTEKYDVTMLNRSIRHRVAVQQVQQRDPQNGGLLDYTDTLMGLTMYEKWQVIDYDITGQYAVLYYCGHMSDDWFYEGTLIYSRAPALRNVDIPTITNVLKTKVGLDFSKMCVPKSKMCEQ